MQWVPSPSVRSIVLVAFLIGLPVLAVPYVSKNFDAAIYGTAKKSVPDLIVSTMPQRTQEPIQIDGVSPARFDESLIQAEPERARERNEGLDAVVTAPPLFNAPPTFAGRLPARPTEMAGGSPVTPEPLAYVQQVRQRLEELGAQYVVLEELDPGRQYRFSVQMQVSPRQPNIRPFEAVANDPAAAARTVLADVESWRTAALPSQTLQR
ncbi:hypothetical protein ETAA8_49280 [Anatilimnocola aggregata]|uniref:Uncharacterized protein n=1 Tax=Anatilimnocola aggregata TaxID=2528021 RepID=A0A517YHV6_9BACT|nr:hypothetical protein [Anatilimnocola aggregata]QDU29813.1 hypothetical protein ETAA8_49280 [Anatilimnocola aggregata]